MCLCDCLCLSVSVCVCVWFEHVTRGTASKTCGARRTFNRPQSSSLRCNKPNTPLSEPSFTTTQPLWHQSQLGKRLCSAAGSFWDDLQSMRLRATAHTFWMHDWNSFGLRTGQHFGPWYVPNVMSLQRRTRRAEQTSSRSSHEFAKLLHQHVLVKKDEPWQLPVTDHQSRSQSRLFKRSSLFPTDPEPQGLFLSEVAEHIPNTLRKMPRLSEPRPLGMRAEHWYDFGSLAGEQRLVCASSRTHGSSRNSSLSSTISQGWTDHTTRQNHRWPQTTSHFVLSPQVGTQISIGSKECGTFAVRCRKTRRSKHDDQNHPVPRGS